MNEINKLAKFLFAQSNYWFVWIIISNMYKDIIRAWISLCRGDYLYLIEDVSSSSLLFSWFIFIIQLGSRLILEPCEHIGHTCICLIDWGRCCGEVLYWISVWNLLSGSISAYCLVTRGISLFSFLMACFSTILECSFGNQEHTRIHLM